MDKRILIWGAVVIVVLAGISYFLSSRPVAAPIAPLETTSTTSILNTTPTSTAPSQPNVPPGTKPVAVVMKPIPSPLLKVTYTGGACPNGKTCVVEKVITASGLYYRDGLKQFQLNKTDTARLVKLIANTNFTVLRSKPFTGTCPTSIGGQEISYSFYTTYGTQTISNCESEIDFTSPIFDLVRQLVPKS